MRNAEICMDDCTRVEADSWQSTHLTRWRYRVTTLRTAGIVLTFAGLMAIGARAFSTPIDAAPRQAALTPTFLQPGHCYRIAFPIEGAPSYKVLELLEGGWMRAEIDSGTAKAQRPSMWVNTAQIVTLREVRCSE